MSSRAPSRERVIGKHVVVLAIYTLLSLLLTWPLITRLTTHVPGDGIDDPALVWNLWWIQERLVNQLSLDIFNVDWMFHPIRINLAFYTLTPLNGLLSVPLQSAFGLVVANNVLFLSTLVLGAYGTFLLTRSLLARRKILLNTSLLSPRPRYPVSTPSVVGLLTIDDWIALVAGMIYGFASSKLFYASLGQFNIASSQWIPFFVLYLLRIPVGRRVVRKPFDDFRSVFLAGTFLVFQTWAELTYATFLIIFAGLAFIYALFLLVHERRSVDESEALPLTGATEQSASQLFGILFAQFALLGVIFVIGLAPFLWAMVPDLLREGDFFTSGGGFSDVFSADLFGYLIPTRLHPWLGDWVAALSFPNDKGQQIYVGYAVMLVALAGVIGLVRSASRRLRSEGWFWLFTTIFFWWLTLGPTVRWQGESLGIPGPFALVSRLPFFSGNRYPSRYSVMLMLCVAILVAYGLAWLIEWLRQRRSFQTLSAQRWGSGIIAILAAAFLVEHLSVPLPLNDFRIPPIYQRLADEPEHSLNDATLLELPTGWRNGARVLGRSDVLIMMQQWYQSEHGQRRLGGNTSRNPAYKFQYFTDAPLIGDLIGLMNADRDHIAQEVTRDWDIIVQRNQDIAVTVLDFLGVEHLIVHVDHAPDPLLRFVDEVLPVSIVDEWQGPDWRGRPSTIRLYRIESEDKATDDIDLGSEIGRLYLADGWSSLPLNEQVRHAIRPTAELMLDLPTEGGPLTLQLFGPATAADLLVNGTFVATASIVSGDWTTVTLPPGVADQVVDRLTIRFNGDGIPSSQVTQPPSSVGWPIGNTGISLVGDSAIVVRSAGEEVGDFAHIYLNGVDVSRNGRGYNLAAIDQEGVLLASDTFDTFALEQESVRMSEWIRQWPAGTIIAGAVRDEASTKLTESAIAGLQQIGVVTDLRGQFRSSHAFVGVVGTTADTLLEERTLLRPAVATVGSPIDAQTVYGGVSAIILPGE